MKKTAPTTDSQTAGMNPGSSDAHEVSENASAASAGESSKKGSAEREIAGSPISRRAFIGSTAALAGGVLLNPLPVSASAYVAGNDTLKLALIGSGSRGAGAVRDALQTEGPVELIAMADVFRDRIDMSYENLRNNPQIRDSIKVPEEHKFTGLDGYKKAIELADVVILATPPAFRPFHFEEAVRAGKHVFMEKPLASDSPGIRKILEAGKQADEKGLKVVVGLQNRYGVNQRELIQRVHDGEIGDITSTITHYIIRDLTLIPREAGQSELEYQLRNWRHFSWLWAGSPAGLTIHYSDIAHWAKQSFPVRAMGTGGRSVYRGPERGDVYDNFYIEFEYADGTRLHSTTRHGVPGYSSRICQIQGTKGTATHGVGSYAGIRDLKGNDVWMFEDQVPNPFRIEHDVLFDAIRNGKHVNDTERGAFSSLAEIMGRMAVQSGQMIEWDQALNSDVVLVPEGLTMDSPAPVQPLEDGNYPYPIPGSTEGIV